MWFLRCRSWSHDLYRVHQEETRLIGSSPRKRLHQSPAGRSFAPPRYPGTPPFRGVGPSLGVPPGPPPDTLRGAGMMCRSREFAPTSSPGDMMRGRSSGAPHRSTVPPCLLLPTERKAPPSEGSVSLKALSANTLWSARLKRWGIHEVRSGGQETN